MVGVIQGCPDQVSITVETPYITVGVCGAKSVIVAKVAGGLGHRGGILHSEVYKMVLPRLVVGQFQCEAIPVGGRVNDHGCESGLSPIAHVRAVAVCAHSDHLGNVLWERTLNGGVRFRDGEWNCHAGNFDIIPGGTGDGIPTHGEVGVVGLFHDEVVGCHAR